MKKVNIALNFFIVSSALVLGIYALYENVYDMLLIATILLWINNICYSIEKFKERAYYFFFNLTFFVFLLGRPLIILLKGNDIEKVTKINYSSMADVRLAVVIMYIALTGMYFGAISGNILKNRFFNRCKKPKTYNKSVFLFHLKYVSLLLFAIAIIAAYIRGVEKVLFILNSSYVEYYVSFTSKLPYLVYVLSTFVEPSLCLFLITYPPKKAAYKVLVLYMISTTLDLVGGERNPFVLSVIFSLIYFIYRDYIGDKEKWIGKFERWALILVTPIGLVLLGMMNYIRDGVSAGFSNVFEIFLDLLEKQGVTFSWLSCGLGILNKLPGFGSSNYTFGGIIDYFKYGSIGQRFFGIEGLGNGNNLRHALNGNSMAHQLSYTLLGDWYLEGHGCGSSYLLEVFADYGKIGIFIFSFFLGMLLISAFDIAKQNMFCGAIMLLSITGTLFMPRSEAIGGINFILRIPFWCTFICCMIGSGLFARKFRRSATI